MTGSVPTATGMGAMPGMRLPADLRDAVEALLARAIREHWATRVWQRDVSLWSSDDEVGAKIAQRLGWLDAPTAFQDEIEELTGFAAGIVESGFGMALVCGMGGSSLAPTVLAEVFPRAAHGITVRVLDSTDPDAVRSSIDDIDDDGVLHVIASKSGTTTETLAFLAHFWESAEHRAGLLHRGRVGERFAAISDPEECIEAIPHSDRFREQFLNPKDVGGRFSALTYVGMVPAALQGLDLAALLEDARSMADACRADETANPGLLLGVALAALTLAGRDKVTLVLEPALASFGVWAEQLVAESCGKGGMGMVPVDGEPLGPPEVYGSDRTFVRLGRAHGSPWRTETDAALDALAAAGHPVIDVDLVGGQWLGGEFFRWEFATAIAGIGIDIDPFDEPDVTESKENTKAVLERFHHDGSLPEEASLAKGELLTLMGDASLGATGAGGAGGTGDAAGGGAVADVLRRHLARARPDGYHQIGAFIAPTEARTAALRDIQALLRDRTHRASTMGYGPRYLHSTGQLHKGGPPTGCFLQLVAGHPDDLPIPGRKETFGVLIDAQALGDFASLGAHGLPVLRVHLSDDPDAGLVELRAALEAALA